MQRTDHLDSRLECLLQKIEKKIAEIRKSGRIDILTEIVKMIVETQRNLP